MSWVVWYVLGLMVGFGALGCFGASGRVVCVWVVAAASLVGWVLGVFN